MSMSKRPNDLIGTTEAAAELKLTSRQVLNLITDGILPAQRIGRDFLIRRADLGKVPKGRKPGPKPKKKSGGADAM
jgi:excisionase family DNA binding protein